MSRRGWNVKSKGDRSFIGCTICFGDLFFGYDEEEQAEAQEEPQATWIQLALFGFPPEENQWKVVETANQRYPAAIREENRSRAAEVADVCIAGGEQSGKTAALVASTIALLLSNATRTLWIVPDGTTTQQREQLLGRIKQRLEDLQLGWLINASRLSRDLGIEWQDEKAILPSILIATPRELRESITENSALADHRRRALLAAYPRIAIDDADQVLAEGSGVLKSVCQFRAELEQLGHTSQLMLSIPTSTTAEVMDSLAKRLGIKQLPQPITVWRTS